MDRENDAEQRAPCRGWWLPCFRRLDFSRWVVIFVLESRRERQMCDNYTRLSFDVWWRLSGWPVLSCVFLGQREMHLRGAVYAFARLEGEEGLSLPPRLPLPLSRARAPHSAFTSLSII